MAFAAYKDHDDDEEELIPIGRPVAMFLTADLRKHCIHVFDPEEIEIGIIERFDFLAMVELVFRSSTLQQMKRYAKMLDDQMEKGKTDGNNLQG